MKRENRNKGRRGENEAVKILLAKGYDIVERNWGNKFGEIDIIAQDRDMTVFVEVKAKTGVEMGTPEEMVGKSKLRKVRNMAMSYFNGREERCRIDVVAVVFNHAGEIERLNHYENVY